MKKFIALFLGILFLTASSAAMAVNSEGSLTSEPDATDEVTAKADALRSLGLFIGTGDIDGVPQYELDGELTRAHAIILLVRMLGKEDAALKGFYPHPFKDTEPWYDKYVGYAYFHGLTMGTGDETYSGSMPTTAEMFATFCLRALGYADEVDFVWSSASVKAAELGITVCDDDTYTRGDAVLTFWDTLNTRLKNAATTLSIKLIIDGVFSSDELYSALQIASGKYDDGTHTDDETTAPEETTPPEETTLIPEETTSMQEEITVPEETTMIPEETTSVQEETTSIPEETTSAPEETTSTPEETSSAPEETSSAPEETTSTPEETTSTPEETSSAPEETTSTPEETSSHLEETTAPEETTSNTESSSSSQSISHENELPEDEL